jgi:hypothetical protein
MVDGSACLATRCTFSKQLRLHRGGRKTLASDPLLILDGKQGVKALPVHHEVKEEAEID